MRNPFKLKTDDRVIRIAQNAGVQFLHDDEVYTIFRIHAVNNDEVVCTKDEDDGLAYIFATDDILEMLEG